MPWRQKPTVTPARLAANRSSALRSTGPRTVAAKVRSRLNALRHSKRSRAYVAAPGAVRQTPMYRLMKKKFSKNKRSLKMPL